MHNFLKHMQLLIEKSVFFFFISFEQNPENFRVKFRPTCLIKMQNLHSPVYFREAIPLKKKGNKYNNKISASSK